MLLQKDADPATAPALEARHTGVVWKTRRLYLAAPLTSGSSGTLLDDRRFDLLFARKRPELDGFDPERLLEPSQVFGGKFHAPI